MSTADISTPSTMGRLSGTIVFISGLAVLVITLMITVDVLMRFFFNKPQLFVDELSSFLLVGVIFLGTAPTFFKGGHIRVDLVTNRLQPQTQRKLRILTLIIGMGLLGIVTYETLLSSVVAYQLGRVSAVMLYPLWTAMLFIPLGLGFMTFFMGMNLRKELIARDDQRKDEAKEIPPENPS